MIGSDERDRFNALARAAFNSIDGMDRFLAEISDDPHCFFLTALERIYETAEYVDNPIVPPPGIELAFSKSPDFDAFSVISEKSITFRKGVITLLRDVAELHVSYEALWSFDGTLLRAPPLSNEEIRQLLKESVKQFVHNPEGAWEESAKLREVYRDRLDWDSSATDTSRTSTSFFIRLLNMIVFIMAHEVGHFLIHVPWWKSALGMYSRSDEELLADRIAAKAMLDYISVPPTVFVMDPPQPYADDFSNMLWAGQWYREQERAWQKGRLEDLLHAIQKSGDAESVVYASEYEACRSASLSVMALFFNVFRLVEIEAKESGVVFSEDYPSSDDRFASFRKACLSHPLSPEDLFSAPNGRRGPIDLEYQRFRMIFD